jgi:hypothetical protein
VAFDFFGVAPDRSVSGSDFGAGFSFGLVLFALGIPLLMLSA